MKIGRPAIIKLSEMICGNGPFNHFPYRSSSQLTKFFIDNDLDFVHDGSTRHSWVQDVLNKLNDQSTEHENLPNRDLIKVITSLVNPDYFLFDEKLDHKKAVEDVNKALKSSKIILKEKLDSFVDNDFVVIDLSKSYNVKTTECQGITSQVIPPSDNNLLIFWIILIIIGVCLIIWLLLNFTSFGINIEKFKQKNTYPLV
jgi:hypothetical protein